MAIPFADQYYVENKRNEKYGWLALVFSIVVLVCHGIVFHWLPLIIRNNRRIQSLKLPRLFKFLHLWNSLNKCFKVKIPWKREHFYFQPSLLILCFIYLMFNAFFCYAGTKEIDYEPRYYIIGKRTGRIAVGNIPFVLILIIKHDLFRAITGLQPDRLIFFHKWVGRVIWGLVTIHLILSLKYWLGLNFKIMVMIPPQIFGMISYACMSFLTWGSLRFIRKWAFDFFLFQHRVFNLIMLLFAFFHNTSGRAAILLGVHLVVLDRVVSNILSIVHKRMAPSKGLSEFEILDDETILVTIPIKRTKMNASKWYWTFLPKVGSWKPGQHIYLNVSKVNMFQFHPFTISSLSSTSEIKLIIRKQKGFTRKLMGRIKKKTEESTDNEEATSIEGPSTVEFKAKFYGPFGSNYQPMITFDSVVFLGAGSGCSFVLPVCLDLLQSIEQKEIEQDYVNRPRNPRITLICSFKKLENQYWYRDMLQKLDPFIQNGMLHMVVYITQEEAPSSHKVEQGNDESSTMTSRNSQSEGPSCALHEYQLISKEEKSIDNKESSYITTEVSGIHKLHYKFNCRPSIERHIQNEASYMRASSNDFKSLAVMSCGPRVFSNEVKIECQRNRYLNSTLDIYCYTETF